MRVIHGADAGSTQRACEPCLRRSGLVAALAGHLDLAWRQRRTALRDVLALMDDELAQSVAKTTADDVLRRHPELLPAAILERCEATGAVAMCRHDAGYPERLLVGADAAAVLYLRGGLRWLDGVSGLADGPERAVAVVGSRRPSPEGEEAARALGRGLAAAGVTVVSGMAMGVDSAAHRGALDAGGPTIAVLGCGADVAYPRTELALHAALGERALIMSELPPGVPPRRWTFPARNRIIAALGAMTVVVEAAERSGSLITAEFASAYGRDVAAVPGRAGSPRTRGSNALIRDGAVVILDVEDALDAVVGTDRAAVTSSHDRLAPELSAVLDDVAGGATSLAALVAAGHQADAAMVALAELELLGLVRRRADASVVAVGC